MNIKDAIQIYKFVQEYGIEEGTLLSFAGFKQSEYDELIKDYLKNDVTVVIDSDKDNELYREYQQANYDEYFDWARTYKYCLF